MRFTLVTMLAAMPVMLQAQGRFPPDTLRNLKVLPATTTPREIVGIMRGFALSLGVRCQYCHVGEEGQDLSTFNFAVDEKPTKEIARTMLRMMQAINGQHLSQIAQRQAPPVEVTCNTCHRGVAVPRPLGEVVTAAVQGGGLDSAVRMYRNLRERFFGRSAYDFGEPTLIQAVQPLLQSRAFDAALGLLRLNAEFYPLSSQTQVGMGETFRLRGDTAAAVAAYRRALQLSPDDPGPRRRLRELGQQP